PRTPQAGGSARAIRPPQPSIWRRRRLGLTARPLSRELPPVWMAFAGQVAGRSQDALRTSMEDLRMTTVELKTLDGNQKRVPAEVIDGLRAGLRGTLCLPGEPGYDTARTIWNAMIDRRPAAIVRAAGAADVMLAVKMARDHQLLLAVRGGGHN